MSLMPWLFPNLLIPTGTSTWMLPTLWRLPMVIFLVRLHRWAMIVVFLYAIEVLYLYLYLVVLVYLAKLFMFPCWLSASYLLIKLLVIITAISYVLLLVISSRTCRQKNSSTRGALTGTSIHCYHHQISWVFQQINSLQIFGMPGSVILLCLLFSVYVSSSH